MAVTSSAAFDPNIYLQARTRWHPIEYAFWASTLLPFLLFPNHLLLASQIAIAIENAKLYESERRNREF